MHTIMDAIVFGTKNKNAFIILMFYQEPKCFHHFDVIRKRNPIPSMICNSGFLYFSLSEWFLSCARCRAVHSDIVQELCELCPELLEDLLDGMLWHSASVEAGKVSIFVSASLLPFCNRKLVAQRQTS